MTAMDWAVLAACQDKDPVLFFGPVDEDEDLSWQDAARCAEADPELWFPERGCSTRPAKRICAGCEVQPQCLEFALARPELFGVWGGLSERERQQLRVAEQQDQERKAA